MERILYWAGTRSDLEQTTISWQPDIIDCDIAKMKA